MIERLNHGLLSPLGEQVFQKALIGGSLVAIVCGVIGSFVILRRMAFLGDALAHAMLAGVTGGYLFMQIVFGQDAHAPAMLVGSLIAGILTVALIGFVSKSSRIKEDTSIGIIYTGVFAVGGILHSLFSHRIHLDLYHFVTGMVLGIEDGDLWMMAFIAVFVLTIVILFYRHLQITTFDPVMAASIGIPVVVMDYVLTACTSLVVVGAVSIVGVILVVGLLVTPAATAYLLSDRLGRMMVMAALFGVSSVVVGLYVSTWIGNIAAGPAIVLAGTAQFLTVLTVAPRYGLIADWWRRRTAVPQRLIEDILGCFRYQDGETIPLAELQRVVKGPGDQIRRGLQTLERQGLLSLSSVGVALTADGQREALRIVRAHRLWESYLEHVGLPLDELHARADELEHVHDETTVDYLDDKLGHPLTDPHGQAIPEDFMHLIPGAEVKLGLLREGHRGTVTRVNEGARHTLIREGMQIQVGARSPDGTRWHVQLPNQPELSLDHDESDAVIIRLEAESSSA